MVSLRWRIFATHAGNTPFSFLNTTSGESLYISSSFAMLNLSRQSRRAKPVLPALFSSSQTIHLTSFSFSDSCNNHASYGYHAFGGYRIPVWVDSLLQFPVDLIFQ
jgi:hypothetical protein